MWNNFNEFNFYYLSGGERRIAIGNIAKQGIHKQCGISLETPKLPSQNLNEKIEVSNLYLHSFPQYELFSIICRNRLNSRKTKLLKSKTVDFSINNKQFSSNHFQKSQNNGKTIIEKYKK